MVSVKLGNQSDALVLNDGAPVLFSWYFQGLYYRTAHPAEYTNPTYVATFAEGNTYTVEGLQYSDQLTFTLYGNSNVAREQVKFYGNDLTIDAVSGRIAAGTIGAIDYACIGYPDLNATISGLSISTTNFLDFANAIPLNGPDANLISFVSEIFDGSDVFFLGSGLVLAS